MPPRLSWSNLIPGLIALAALVGVGFAVLKFAGVGKVRGETVRIHVLTDQARGIIAGSEVWLDGQKAGAVHHVGFRAPSADTLHRVVIAVDIVTDAAARLRQDSRISVRAGGNIIGPVVVYIESGTPSGLAVHPGDTLRALAQSDVAATMQRVSAATAELPALMADAKTVMRLARDPNTTVGAVLTRGLPREAGLLRANVAALRSRGGSEPRDDGPGPLRRNAASVMARVDSIRALLASPNTSLGRFRRDTSLPRVLAGIRADLDTLSEKIAESPGTLSRLRSDSALTRSVADARREMALLFEDVQRRPLRYINF